MNDLGQRVDTDVGQRVRVDLDVVRNRNVHESTADTADTTDNSDNSDNADRPDNMDERTADEETQA